MIKSITIYTAICDGCGTDICNGTGFSGWDITGIENELSELNWVEVKETHPDPLPNQTHLYKHYCPNCYEYEGNNKLILKEKQ